MTELDLDAFLQSHDNSNDDEHYHHHRTIDEILLSDSSSDTDSPPSSLNQSQGIHHFSSDLSDSDNAKLLQQTHPGVFDDSLGSFDETLVSSETSRLSRSQLDEKYVSSKFRSTNSVKSSGEVSGDSFSLSLNVLSPLSPFFGGGIRSNTNAKPGAALAAAAAASRSISTRHAVAIKSRRAASATLPKVLDQVLSNDNSGYGGASTAILRSGSNFEESSGVSDDVHDVAGCEVTESDGNFLYAEEDAKSRDDFQSVLDDSGEFSGRDRVGGSSADSEVSPSEKILPEVSHVYNDVNKLSFYDDDNSGNDLSSLVVKNQLASGTNADRDQGVECKDDKPPASNENNLVTFESIRDSPSTDEEGISYSPFCEQGKELTHADTLDEEKVVEPHSKIVGTIHAGLDSGSKSDADTHNEEKVVEPHSQIVGTIHAGLDSSSRSDATILIGDTITQSEKKRVNRRTGLKSWSSLKPLEVAEELEKKQAFTGLHWEEGAAAQPMRLEGVKRGSTLLGYFDINANNIITRTISSQAFRRDHGSPQSIAVHLNFIAIGMSRGVIVVQPSKYSPHYVDNMDAKMFLLGLQGDRSLAPVTAMCFSQQGDLLFAGYGDGHITVWEVQKASVAKLIHEHKAPVVHLLYLGQEDSQVTRQYNIVSGDNKGVIWLIHLTVLTWLNRYSYKTTKLFDETRSTVVCASPLISDESCGGALMAPQGNTTVSSGSISGMVGSVAGGEAGRKAVEGLSLAEGVVIFVTLQSALVAKVRPPQVEIYAQLSRPEGVREGSMPYTAWRSNVTVEASERISLLAIAWDRKVQVGKLVKSELKMYGTWTLDSSAIGVAWLDDQMLVVLTSTGHLCLFAKDGNMIHQTSFAVDGSRGDDFIAYHTQFSNIFGNPEKAYHNCVAVRGASIYVLGSLNLVVSRLLPWKERIEVLRKAGDWMGALNMAIALYDGQAHGIIDLPRALDDVQRAVMSYLVELLLSYVDEVFSYMTVAFRNQIEKVNQSDDSKSRSGCVHSEIKEQFTRVGGVAVEFCVHTKRTDILFDEIFSRFVSVQHGETFLELLEPYILKDMLGSLPPEIMQALVENYSKKGWLQRVEQCVLHMDISSLDFNQVVRLCREHRLYGALIYLFNKGLDDFRAPLEELIVVLQNSDRESAAALGYRILVYLKYCFSGLAFPPGRGNLPSTRLLSIRKELIEFLLEDSRTPNSLAKSSITSAVTYPNLYNLLELDNEATLDVLRCAFPDDEMDCRSRDSADSNVDPMEGNSSMSGNQDLLQRVVDVLAFIVDTAYFHAERSTSRNNAGSTEIWPSKRDIVFLFEFIAYYVACQRANITKDILSQILEHLTSETEMPLSVSRQNIEAPKRREKQLLALLSVVPETDWDPPYLLHLCEKAQFYQVCGFIHATRHNYLSALDSYLKDVDEPIHAFSFINDMLTRLIGEEFDAFKSAVISRISDLVILSREGTFLLIVDHLSRESEHILSDLRSHPESLFLYLKTVVELHSTGTLNFSSLRMGDNANMRFVTRTRIQTNRVDAFMEKISHFPKFLLANPVNITDHMIELYLELLCQYERNSVLKFLETFENYRVEHCLRLCQEYEITDAAAFLFERVGEAGTALLLMLSGLNDKFIVLEAAVGSVLSDTEGDHFETVLKNEEVNDILNVVHACVRLCQRNSPRLAPDESESLWFQLLDSFCEPLMDSRNDKIASEVEKCVGIQTDSFVRQEDEEAYRIKWKLPRSHKGVYILRKLFSMYIKEIVEGMIGYVRLPTIMSKLLSDNGSQEFGDFKHTIMGMLGMYDFERRILDTAKSLIEDDTFYTLSILKKGASHGYAPRSLICCICNCVFGKNISTSSIRIFNCGHANHIQCEIQENEALQRPFSQGCPICMPNKKAAQISENTSVLVENGSVSAFKTKLGQGSLSLHPHETDAFEKSYGLLPNARFEILANLQKDRRFFQVENINQLRLSPPAVYHEKVKKGSDLLIGESSSSLPRKAKPSRSRQLRDVKLKGSGIRFSLNSNIVGKEKTIKQ